MKNAMFKASNGLVLIDKHILVKMSNDIDLWLWVVHWKPNIEMLLQKKQTRPIFMLKDTVEHL